MCLSIDVLPEGLPTWRIHFTIVFQSHCTLSEIVLQHLSTFPFLSHLHSNDHKELPCAYRLREKRERGGTRVGTIEL